jgi:hypothetical protein
MFMAKAPIKKDPLIREKHTNTFHVLCDAAAFIIIQRPKEIGKPSYF